MANTSSRMLRLLSLLETHRYWPGAELAARLEVSARTLRRDIDRLRDLGYPVQAQRGVDGGYQLAAGAALPPLVLEDDEAVALAIGLRTAAQGAVEGIEEASVRALAKVARVMPPRLRRRVEAVRAATVPAVWASGPAVDAEVLTAVAHACRDQERLRFAYTAGNGETTSRHVEPYRLVPLGRRWYLVAYDLGRQDWRIFRLDRVKAVRATGLRFRPRALPGDDAAAFVRAAIGNIAASQQAVEALIDAPAALVRGRVGQWASVEAVDDGHCRARMRVDNLDWATAALGAVGADFTVLGPPELIERVREWTTRFVRSLDSMSGS
jgi:predicted DNA-binding transcriptional regulator YafY